MAVRASAVTPISGTSGTVVGCASPRTSTMFRASPERGGAQHRANADWDTPMLLRSLPCLTSCDAGFRDWFHSKWGHENCVVWGRALRADFVPHEHCLS